SQPEQSFSRGFVLPLASQCASQGEDVALLVPTLDRRAPEEVDRSVSVARVELTLAALVPLGGVAQAHVAIVRGDGTRDEEGGDCDGDQQHQLENLSMDEVGPLVGVVGAI